MYVHLLHRNAPFPGLMEPLHTPSAREGSLEEEEEEEEGERRRREGEGERE